MILRHQRKPKNTNCANFYLKNNIYFARVINKTTIDRIFDASDIVEVISDFINITKKGADYKGVCPFHDDKNPSMSVSPSRGIYKCFSCGAGGNALKFVMEIEGLTYPQALRYLAKKYHIEIEEDDTTLEELDLEANRKEGIYNALEFAKNHFKHKLVHAEEGKIIYLPYLLERGLRKETIEIFNLGLSGLAFTEFLNYALKNSFSPQQLFEAGLVKKNNEEEGVLQQNLRDTFVERIVFPINDVAGKVIGFGGRIIKKDTKAPKYLNSPETLVYEKRKVLYGLFQNKQEIRKRNEVILVEGYMDVISLHQVGLNYAIAASGTAFTTEQARLIKRFCENVILLFDGDVAGVNAAIKHIETLLSADLNLKIVTVPEGEDPDSLAVKLGRQGMEDFIAQNQKNFVDFFISVKTDGSSDPLQKAEAAKLIAQSCAAILDPLKRNSYIQEAANQLKLDATLLLDETNRVYREKRKEKEIEKNVSNLVQFDDENILEQNAKKESEHFEKSDCHEILLKIIIKYGHLDFEDGSTVLDFIMSELENEDLWPESEDLKMVFMEIAEKMNDDLSALDENFYIRNLYTSELAAEVFSEKYKLSEAWLRDYDKKVETADDNYRLDVISNLNYLKLSKIENLIKENQEKIKTVENDEELMDLLKYDMRLKEVKKEVTKELGIVIKSNL